jgi:ABC-2 type transport system permease protein
VSTPAVPYDQLGPPIQGPRALTSDWRRFWHLTFNIARNNWKLRFFGSALGYLWQLIRPLMLFGVLYVFFTVIAHVGRGPLAAPGKPNHFYGAQLLGSIVLFTLMAESTGNAVRCVVDQEQIVRKIQFPRMVIPLSVVMFSLFNVSLNLIVVFVFALLEGVRPMLSWLEVPFLVAILAVFCTGLAMLLSSLFVYFRDIQPIWEVLTQVLFYSAPVIIPITSVTKALQHHKLLLHLYIANPLAAVLQQFRHAVINHATPSVSRLLGGKVELAIPLGIVVFVFVLGFYVFNRVAPTVAEDL